MEREYQKQRNRHQYWDRKARKYIDEQFLGDRAVRFLYGRLRENFPILFRVLTSKRIVDWLSFLIYDVPVIQRKSLKEGLFSLPGVDWSECLEGPKKIKRVRDFFERKIRYWETRPMCEAPGVIVSPCDARLLLGDLVPDSLLFLKEKIFSFPELLDGTTQRWSPYFQRGSYAIFRLTPEKYHFNHLPVSGRIADYYSLEGNYHSCHPSAVVALVTPYSKNKRSVTVIDTDVENGTRCGLVAMVEVAALLVGDILQCYSEREYEDPQDMTIGLFVKKGQPKSLFRPGSSTTVLFFEEKRVRFCPDLIRSRYLSEGKSLFSDGFNQPLMEIDVQVRSPIGVAVKAKQ
jgi:phosphatidylserine decarboxylase